MNPVLFATVIAAASTPIDEVVLLPDRAEIIRKGGAPCANGTTEVIFDDLPISLDARTLRAEAEGRTEVLGLRYEIVEDEGARTETARKLERELEELRDEKLTLEHAEQRQTDDRARLDRITELYRTALSEETRSARPNRKAWQKNLDQVAGQRRKLADASRKLAVQRRDWSRRHSRVIRSLRKAAGREKRSVRATVATACRGSARVLLAYVVPQARWQPEYDVDFQPAGKRSQVKLTVSAIIEQSTGEDWNNVKLRLSTARPKLGADAPLPAPIRIDGREKEKERVLVQGYEKRDRLAAGGGPSDKGPVGAQLDDGGNTVLLTLPGRVTVIADGRKHWFPVDETKTRAVQKWIALPRLKRGVFRVAAFDNPARYPLVAGRINSFVRGAFVGYSSLALTGSGEPMEVSLGIEPGLALERKQRVDKDAVKGFLSRSKHMARAYRSTISNRTGRGYEIEVREQLPVSQNKAIKIRVIEEGTTPKRRLDADRGMMSFPVKVGARQKQAVDIAFEIELPNDWKVN